jgi:GNAT superfamily N-acetyltransferase
MAGKIQLMLNIAIRGAASEEAGRLSEIAVAAKRHWGYPERWIALWTPLLTLTPEDILKGGVFVAVVEQQVAAFYRLMPGRPRARLEDLWVEPGWIGQGLGAALFQHAVAGSRAAGASVLEIESDPNAQGFYEKMGAHKVGDRQSEVDGHPRRLPIMEINL